MFLTPLVLYGTTGGFTAAKLCILKLLLVAKYSQYLIQSWHGGRTTSYILETFATAFEIRNLPDVFKDGDTWPTNFVEKYYNDEEHDTSDMAIEKLLGRHHNIVNKVL